MAPDGSSPSSALVAGLLAASANGRLKREAALMICFAGQSNVAVLLGGDKGRGADGTFRPAGQTT
jgi:hypothetical protein